MKMKKAISIVLAWLMLLTVVPVYANGAETAFEAVYEDFNYYETEDFLRSEYTASPQNYANFLSVRTENSQLVLNASGEAGEAVSFTKKLLASADSGTFVLETKYTRTGAGAEIALTAADGSAVVTAQHTEGGSVVLCGTDTGISVSDSETVLRMTVNLDAQTASVSIYDGQGANKQSSGEISITAAALNGYRLGIAPVSGGESICYDYLYIWKEADAPNEIGKDNGGFGEKAVTVYQDPFGYALDATDTGYTYSEQSSSGHGELVYTNGYPTVIRKTDTVESKGKNDARMTRAVPEATDGQPLNGKIRVELSYEVDVTKKSLFYADFKCVAIQDEFNANADGKVKVNFKNYSAYGNWSAADGGRRDFVFDIDYTNQLVKVTFNGKPLKKNTGEEAFEGAFKKVSASWGAFEVQNRCRNNTPKGDANATPEGSVGSALSVRKFKISRIEKGQGSILLQKLGGLTAGSITPSPDAVTENLTLPNEIDGAAVTWRSNKPSVISADGTVTPSTVSDETVILSATAEDAGIKAVRTFVLTVIKREPSVEPEITIEPDFCDDFNYASLDDYLADGGISLLGWENYWILGTPNSAFRAELKVSENKKDVSVVKPLRGCTSSEGVFDLRFSRTDGAAFSFALLDNSYRTIAEAEIAKDGKISLNGLETNCVSSNAQNIIRLRLKDGNVTVSRYEGITREERVTSDGQPYSGMPAYYRLTMLASSVHPEGTTASMSIKKLSVWNNPAGLPKPVTDDLGGYYDDMNRLIYEDTFGFDSTEAAASAGYMYSGKAEDGELRIVDGYPAVIRKNADGGRALMIKSAPGGLDLSGKLRLELCLKMDMTKKSYFYLPFGFTAVYENFNANPGITNLFFRNHSSASNPINFGLTHTTELGGVRDFSMDIDFGSAQSYSAELKIPNEAPKTGSSVFRNAAQSLPSIEIQNRGKEGDKIVGSEGSMIIFQKYRILRPGIANEVLKELAEKISAGQLAPDPMAVTGNLTLPPSIGSAAVTWESSEPQTVSDSGEVVRPLDEDKRVVMYATVSENGAHMKKAYEITVKAQNPQKYYFLNSNTAIRAGSEWNFDAAAKISDGMVVLDNAGAKLALAKKGTIGLGGKAEITFDWQNESGKSTVEIIGGGKTLLTLSADEEKLFANGEALSADLSQKQAIRAEFDMTENTASVYADGSLLKDMIALTGEAVSIDEIKISADGRTKIGNPCGYNLISQLPAAILSQIEFDRFTDEPASNVKQNLTIPSSPIADIDFRFESKNTAIANDGTVTRGGENAVGNICLNAVYLPDESIRAVREYAVTVPSIDSANIAYRKTTQANLSPAAGSSLAYLTDGDLSTVFRTRGGETSAEFVIDLEQESIVGLMEIAEETPCIKKVCAYVSNDKINWTQLYEGEPEKIGDSFVGKGRYVKISVTEKNERQPLAISELIIRNTYTDAQAVRTDLSALEKLIPAAGSVLTSFSVPSVGEYGTRIALTSDQPFVTVSEQNGMYTVNFTAQSTDRSVILSFGVNKGSAGENLNVQYTVRGSGSGGSGGSSGGGSGRTWTDSGSMVDFIPSGGTSAGKNGFSDVSENHWAKTYIEDLLRRKIVSGSGNGTFEPERAVTREEFLKMLVCALPSFTKDSAELPFTDTEQTAWYYPYLQKAYAAGLTTGAAENKFGIGKEITREEIAVFIARALSLANCPLKDRQNIAFADETMISDYAKQSVALLAAAGILNGYEDKTFMPQGTATRAEAAKLLSVLISEVG